MSLVIFNILAVFNAIMYFYVLPIVIWRCCKRRNILIERDAIIKERFKLLIDRDSMPSDEWNGRFEDTAKRFSETTKKFEKVRGFLFSSKQ